MLQSCALAIVTRACLVPVCMDAACLTPSIAVTVSNVKMEISHVNRHFKMFKVINFGFSIFYHQN